MSGFNGRIGVGSKFIQSPAAAVQKSKFYSKSAVDGSGDQEELKNFYRTMEKNDVSADATETKDDIRVSRSRSSIDLSSRKSGKHFAKLKQKLMQSEIRKSFKRQQRREGSKKIKIIAEKVDDIMEVLHENLNEKKTSSSSSLMKEIVETSRNHKKTLHAVFLIAIVLLYFIAIAFVFDSSFHKSPSTKNSYSIFSSSPPDDDNSFGFFTKFLK